MWPECSECGWRGGHLSWCSQLRSKDSTNDSIKYRNVTWLCTSDDFAIIAVSQNIAGIKSIINRLGYDNISEFTFQPIGMSNIPEGTVLLDEEVF